MRALVCFRLPDGREVELGPGDLVGRLANARLRIDDPRISEAHAMVSLRGGELKLLALRRMVAVGGKPVSEVTLEVGLVLQLADDLVLEVVSRTLPTTLLAIEAEGLPRQIVGAVCSLYVTPRPRLAMRYDPEASAHLWWTGEGYHLAIPGEEPRLLSAGDSVKVAGLDVRAVAVQLDAITQAETRERGGIHAPLRIVARYTSVQVQREGREALMLSGVSARIVSELVSFDAPVGWETLAQEIWPEESDRRLLRRKWDVNLGRLRGKLRDAQIRDDLVRSDRAGNVELVLLAQDAVDDQQ